MDKTFNVEIISTKMLIISQLWFGETRENHQIFYQKKSRKTEKRENQNEN